MDEIKSFLRSIGLDESESQVYIESMRIGTVAASNIGNKLKIPRSTARYICENLVKKWLMIETKRWNTKLFTAENPSKLASIIYDEELHIRTKRNNLTRITPQLQKLYNPFTVIPEVTFYEGNEGVEKMLLKVAGDAGDVFTFSAGDYIEEQNPDLIERFREKALKLDRNVYIIRPLRTKTKHSNKKIKQYNTKYFSPALEDLKVDIQIRQDKISIISINEASPIGVIIQDQAIAQAFQQVFKEVWQKASE